jgi:hypothetical protein
LFAERRVLLQRTSLIGWERTSAEGYAVTQRTTTPLSVATLVWHHSREVHARASN